MNFYRIALLSIVAFCLTACGTTAVHEYPRGWPPLAGMSSDCREVQGTYIDTNEWGHVFDKNGVVTGNTGEITAWYAFGLNPSSIRSNETQVRNRAISISYDGSEILVMNYYIEGNILLSKRIPDTQWSCSKDGLNLTTMENSDAGFDKLPGSYSGKRTSTFYRVGNQLIVKIINSGQGMLLYALPKHDYSVSWYSFKTLP